ncbi:MAG: hypothetical protein HFJ65_05220 [Eggerthellaceae bacterium]|nr:hypothetical protein [Eggerthellaceae bacterium]
MTKIREDAGFLPIILGSDIATYSLARTFHERYGITSVALSKGKYHLCGDSSIIESVIDENMDDADGFADRLLKIAEAYPGKQLILMACGDWYVDLILANREKLEERFVIPYIPYELHKKLVAKDKFYEICEELDVPYPKTMVIDCANPPEDISALEIPFSFPIIAKAASTPKYHYVEFEGKKKVFKFSTREEFDEMFGRLVASGYDDKLIVQDFIPGDDTNMRILTCYMDRDSNLRFAAFGQTLMEDPTDNGIGNPVAIINRVNPEVVEAAKRLLEGVGYTGFANFDVKYDSRDGSYRFFEINPRLGRSNYYVTAGGNNTVQWIVDDLICHKDFQGVKIANEDGSRALFTVVSKDVLLDYVKDEGLRNEVKELYREGKAVNPIDYKAEKKLIRRIYPKIFLKRQTESFKPYL